MKKKLRVKGSDLSYSTAHYLMKYYYLNEHRKPIGPIDEAEIGRLYNQELITSETLISYEGASKWIPVSQGNLESLPPEGLAPMSTRLIESPPPLPALSNSSHQIKKVVIVIALTFSGMLALAFLAAFLSNNTLHQESLVEGEDAGTGGYDTNLNTIENFEQRHTTKLDQETFLEYLGGYRSGLEVKKISSPNEISNIKDRYSNRLEHLVWRGGFYDAIRGGKNILADVDFNRLPTSNRTYDFNFYCRVGDVENVVKMLKKSPSPQELVNQWSSSGSPLHSACSNGNFHVVELLLQYGADVNRHGNHVDRNYSPPIISEIPSPLIKACSFLPMSRHTGHRKTLQLLISKGARIDGVTSQGKHAIHLAARGGDVDIVKALISQGASLHQSTERTQRDIEEDRIFRTIDENNQSFQGDTPIQISAKWGNIELCEYLIKHGANVTTRATNGRTPLDFYLHSQHTPQSINLELIRLLDKSGVTYNQLKKTISSDEGLFKDTGVYSALVGAKRYTLFLQKSGECLIYQSPNRLKTNKEYLLQSSQYKGNYYFRGKDLSDLEIYFSPSIQIHREEYKKMVGSASKELNLNFFNTQSYFKSLDERAQTNYTYKFYPFDQNGEVIINEDSNGALTKEIFYKDGKPIHPLTHSSEHDPQPINF